MTFNNRRKYAIEHRELIASADGLRVQVLTVGPGQCVPWHHYTQITDSFFCLEGPMVIQTQAPDAVHELHAGDRLSVPPNRLHTVFTKHAKICRFVIVQGVGRYDYVPLTEGR
jgi:quercetin dioxygenase-like cupin family protein